MNKNKQIIVRMTEEQKTDLETISKKSGVTVSKLIRDFITDFINKNK